MLAINFIYNRFFTRLACFIFWLVTCPSALGQDYQKRALTTPEYDMWSLLIPAKLSNKGNWASYLLSYKSKNDTLFVQHTLDGSKYYFPFGKKGRFNGESAFACIARDTLIFQDLKTGIVNKKPGAADFMFSTDQKFLVCLLKQTDKRYHLIIHDTKGKLIFEDFDISHWYFDPLRNGILYTTETKEDHDIAVVTLNKKVEKKMISSGSKTPFLSLSWKGKSIAFLQGAESPILFTYNILESRLLRFDPKNMKNFPSDGQISTESYSKIMISNDGNKIFFWLKENQLNDVFINPDKVEIWNTKDRLLFDHKKYLGEFSMMDKMAVWSLEDNTFLQLTSKDLPRVFLTADYSHAFTYDPIAYEPQNNFDGPFDLYITDIKSGQKKCILKKYSSDYMPTGSPDGRYLCYVKEANWWIYDIIKDLHINITKESSESFFMEDSSMPIVPKSYGIGGWTKNGNIILYDKFDLWQFALDGSNAKRLTNGKLTQKTFRIKNFNPRPSDIETSTYFLNLTKGLLLETIDKTTGFSGLSKFDLKMGLSEMIWKSKKINQVSTAEDENIYMYVEQNYQSAPTLMLYNGRPKSIIQSNSHQQHFFWGKNEPINYVVKGRKMQGILYYPANYKEELKYPMIVHIYENQFRYLNNYENPTLYSGDGFNVSNFTANGYFVLLPNINYEIGNLVDSVTNSVLSAVDTVLTNKNIDPEKIGLIGHSFGGYETDLIITQTNRFAAAVSGAAWTDLVSSYLYIGASFRRPDFYRAEYDQLRIGKSLFEDMQTYLKNSPVLLAASVKTPLLGWTGQEDRHIHTLQSFEFYMALRRLNKTHTLLVYPQEGHNLENKENQRDLSNRIMQWFDYYLKGSIKQDWMKSDL